MSNANELGELNINHSRYKTRLSNKFIGKKPYRPLDPKLIVSFIPGTVLDILVEKGQAVKKGEDLIILDAMKMQNRLNSATSGRIKKILVSRGDKVSKGSILIEIE